MSEEKDDLETVEKQEVPVEEAPPQPPPELRVAGLFGDIDEKKAEELIYAMLLLSNEGPEDIDLILSSVGGSALEMFAIYDVMRFLREKMDISTTGIGKVMSAAVILLASGTKGKRRCGRHCRLMIHAVISGTQGSLHDLRTEMGEVEYTQDKYISALAQETDLTEEQIREIFSKNVNTYLSAEEALEYGIIDEIV
jgi:ATP-dependent Clp protease protease subunit